jgi:putative transposase
MAKDDPQLRLAFPRRRTRSGRLALKPGPKPSKVKHDVAHRARPDIDVHGAAHVVVRVVPELAPLRSKVKLQAIRRGLEKCAARSDFRVVAVSVQNTHIHLLVEAEDKRAMWAGMQSFTIATAKTLNGLMERGRARVFSTRYHTTVVTTAAEARHELVYVLNNWRRHRLHVGSPFRVDPCSSAPQFAGWATAHGDPVPDVPMPVVAPQSWILREGWTRLGLIELDEVAGPESGPEVHERPEG